MKDLTVALVLLLLGCMPAVVPAGTPTGAPSPPPTIASPSLGPSTSASPLAGIGEIVESRSGIARNPADAATAEQLAAMVGGDQAFAFDLYRSLITTEPGNVFFSPYSISTALSMVLAGARGSTAEELAAALHVEDDAAWHLARNRLELELAAVGRLRYDRQPRLNAVDARTNQCILRPDWLSVSSGISRCARSELRRRDPRDSISSIAPNESA